MTIENLLELRYLVALAAVAREQSFTRAADSLGYTQSAVSQQIGRLERLVGHELVERPGGTTPVSLTVAGRMLLVHADAIVAQLGSARADLAALTDGSAGVLRIGCYQSVGARILPRVLSRFRSGWPGVTVELTEAEDDGELLAQVERGELDLTFVAYPMMLGPFGHLELMEDPYVVVVRDDSPLGAGADPVHVPELSKQVAFRSNDNGTILGLAAEGVGAAVISWMSVDPFRPGVRVRALAGVGPRIVGIAWHRDRYRLPAADAFVRLAQQEALSEHRLALEALHVPGGDA